MRVLCVYRDERYSPNSVEKDKAILDAAGKRLCERGHTVSFVSERQLSRVDADVCLSMARSESALEVMRQSGARCVNHPDAIALCCHRSALDRLMRENDIAMPPVEGADGYWLKRGDGVAEEKDDIVFCANEQALKVARQEMASRGISEQVVSTHVKGDLLKFYGVRGSGFFRCYYPADDGVSKFGNEEVNGKAHHYHYDEDTLRSEAERLARLAQVDVYGGDCIVRSDGTLVIIDFNDWPSFSRCREEAACAIAKLIDNE